MRETDQLYRAEGGHGVLVWQQATPGASVIQAGWGGGGGVELL